MAETIVKRITKVNGNGFQVEGYADDQWFNLSKSHEDQITIPPVGTEIEFTFNRWLVPNSDKIMWFVDEIIPVTQVAAPIQVAGNSYAANSYARQQQAAAQAAAPTPMSRGEPPLDGPQAVPEPSAPVLGTHAYTSLSIERQVALKAAVETLNHVQGEYENPNEASSTVLWLAEAYNSFLNNRDNGLADVAMPDDTLVKTPSEMAEPPPEYRG